MAFFVLGSGGHRSDRLPLGESTVLCSRMDESIIVGYYTSAEVDSTYSQPSQIAHKRSLTHGKKRWN